MSHQSRAADDALGKLGLTQTNGAEYYLWTFTWGLGWVPALAAIGGAVLLALRDRRRPSCSRPRRSLFVIFMGTQSRFFGRWLMPVFPIVCVLAGYAVIRLAEARAAPARAAPDALRARRRPALRAGAARTRCTSGRCSRAPTPATSPARGWSPTSSRTAGSWSSRWCPTRGLSDLGHPYAGTANGQRWSKFPTSRTNVAHDGSIEYGVGEVVNIEDYERELQPGLIDLYEQKGYC